MIIEEVRILTRPAWDAIWSGTDQRRMMDDLFWARAGHQAESLAKQRRPEAAGRGITPAGLRAIPWGTVFSATKTEYVFRAEIVEELGIFPTGFAEHVALEPRRPGRAGYGIEWYSARAAEYVKLCASGERAPVAALARMHHYSYAAAHDWIERARNLKLLTRPPKGVKGGQLTDLARSILESAENEGKP
jgi:hypothetical protein